MALETVDDKDPPVSQLLCLGFLQEDSLKPLFAYQSVRPAHERTIVRPIRDATLKLLSLEVNSCENHTRGQTPAISRACLHYRANRYYSLL